MTRTQLIKLAKRNAKHDPFTMLPEVAHDPQLRRIFQRKRELIQREEREIARVAKIAKSQPLPHAIVRSAVIAHTKTLFSPLGAQMLMDLHRYYKLDEHGNLVQKHQA